MKVMPQEKLIELRNKLPDSLVKSFIDSLIAECEELPLPQWQTIEEFKANPVDGWYWINYDNVVYMSYYKLNIFFENDHAVDSSIWESDCITHVMPIKTPEAPK